MSIDERIESLLQSIKFRDRQIGELTANVGELTGTAGTTSRDIATLVKVTNENATAIRTLARIAEMHDKREPAS
jgi:ABC-type transporter Mla subunit MlaD